MKKTVIVDKISKTYTLSKKQQKIERSNITKKIAVDNLSFFVVEGEIYGLLGPNGAGKTTTLRCISTLIKPDSGDIVIDNYSVTKEASKVRETIGFLTSELKLEDFFTPNYLYDFFSELHHVDKKIANERKEKLFKKFGIEKFKEVKVGELSTGMRQKVQIVISIVHDPKIIIFDEPTNGLDVLTAKVVTDFLIDLKKQGKTIIVSTHNFSLVEKICDRVGIIIDGILKSEGPLDDILNKNQTLEEYFFDLISEDSIL